ncbi:MAG TPA: D-2-hydroxyacid dehydrogenase [Chloroflexi bacterium]|nr:D-2-hydroxyacid dehydrogenase [Chloroflexota bacterium]
MGSMSDQPIHLLMTVSFPQPLLDRLRAISPQLKIHSFPAREAEALPEDLLPEIEILYTISALPDPELVPNLRWVQLHFAGADHLLGHPLLSKEDLIITTMSGASAPQMAEFALMCMLALGHRLPQFTRGTPAERWSDDRYARFQPLELRGSTVGIVGYGSVGREVARLCHAFGAQVLAVKHDLKHLEDEGYLMEGLGDPQADIPQRIYPPQALKSMASLCDFLVITVPLTGETQGLVDEAVFQAMPPHAYLVDISRGGIVDHGALVEALNNETIAGAALDVYPIEPLPESSPLWKHENVILSPHLAGASPHYFERAADLFAANLQRYLSDRPLLNVFDPARGY